MSSSQQIEVKNLLSAPINTLSASQKSHLLSLLIAQGINQPDTRFELAYQLYNANPNTDQSINTSYINRVYTNGGDCL